MLARRGLSEPLLGTTKHIHYIKRVIEQDTWVSVATWIPNTRFFMQQSRWSECGIAWTVGGGGEDGRSAEKTEDHFSMLPDGWIPDDSVEFFQLFIIHLTKKWSDLCNEAEEHLSDRVSCYHYPPAAILTDCRAQRTTQLQSQGRSEMVKLLAEDSQNLAELCRCIRSQVRDARKFIADDGHSLGAGVERRALKTIESFAGIEDQLHGLDQTIRDLLQLVSAYACTPTGILAANSIGIRLGLD